MSSKSSKIEALIASCKGGDLDARYLAFFDCFNRQLFFEAHEVLEDLWLPQRGKPLDFFYKGLIQLAGAFVHLQKNRRGPAMALLELARANLQPFSPLCERLEIKPVLDLIALWKERIGGPRDEARLLPPGEEPALALCQWGQWP